jgi:hypothetical protein
LLNDAATLRPLPIIVKPSEDVMKDIVSATVVAVLLAVSLSAQGQSQQPAPPGQPGEQSTPRAPQATTSPLAKVTISGCVQNPPPAAPAAGAVPSAPAASKFDLANAKMVTPAAVGTSGTAAAVTRYRLEGDEKIITPHLNHQVEITGTVSPASGTAATAAPMLKVESVKMVAAKCP